MTRWGDDRLVIFGGSDTNENFLNDVFVLSLSQLTWEKLVCSGDIPTGRTKHSAVIHENKLIISGGCQRKDEDISNQVNILDLNSKTWDAPRNFIHRHAHNSWVYQDRLYIYGGFDDNMDRVKCLSFMDLLTGSRAIISIDSPNAPCHMEQQHVQCFGKFVVVVGVPVHWRGADDVSQMQASGVWALDLDALRWQRLSNGHILQPFVWHYHAIDPVKPMIYLLGENPANDEDGFMSNILIINLEYYGISSKLDSTMSAEFGQLLQQTHLADFRIISSTSPGLPEVPVHRLILMTRWPYFLNLVSSGMSETTTETLSLKDTIDSIRLFVTYLYTDTLQMATSRTYADVMSMANRYCLPRLQRLCSAKLMIAEPDTDVVWVYLCAMRCEESVLCQRTLEFILEHFGMVSKTKAFRGLSGSDVDDLWNSLPDSARLIY
ncbi:hypothetical protein RTP6_003589 [Batrachochytrium dendrobatidis]